MPPQATGTVIAPSGERQRSWAIRFRADGKRRFVTLGRPEDGWTRQRAEDALALELDAVARGTWKPAKSRDYRAVLRDALELSPSDRRELCREIEEANRLSAQTIKMAPGDSSFVLTPGEIVA